MQPRGEAETESQFVQAAFDVGTSASIFTPSAASTSAEPDLLVMLRLPCFATATPGRGRHQRGGGADIERT